MVGPAGTSSTLDAADPLLCPACGYDLRGAESERCPECGLAVDRAELARSSIPWDRWKSTWSYMKTVWRVSVGAKSLRYEAVKPQDAAAARLFQRVTSVLALFAVLVGLLHVSERLWVLDVVWTPPESPYQNKLLPGWALDLVLPWSAGFAIHGVAPASFAVFVWRATQAHRPLFRLKGVAPRRAEHAMAISAYAGAPWARLLLAPIAWAVLTILIYGHPLSDWIPFDRGRLDRVDRVKVWVVAYPVLLLTALRIAQWGARVRQGDWLTVMGKLAQLCFCWAWEALLCLGILPWCVGYFVVVIDGLAS